MGGRISERRRAMRLEDLKEKAERLGVKPGRMKKSDLIHAIQRAEGYEACYGTSNNGCPHLDCAFLSDCAREGKNAWVGAS